MIRILFDRSKYLSRRADGKQELRAELIADTAAELDGVTKIGENVLAFGSLCHTVQDAEIYALGSDGVWYKTSSSGALEAQTAGTNGLTLSKQTGRLGDTVGLAAASAVPDDIPDEIPEEVQNDEPEERTESE
jgi:hypothetical protein